MQVNHPLNPSFKIYFYLKSKFLIHEIKNSSIKSRNQYSVNIYTPRDVASDQIKFICLTIQSEKEVCVTHFFRKKVLSLLISILRISFFLCQLQLRRLLCILTSNVCMHIKIFHLHGSSDGRGEEQNGNKKLKCCIWRLTTA